MRGVTMNLQQNKITYVLILLASLALSACGGGGGDAGGSGGSGGSSPTYSVDCSTSSAYTLGSPPVTTVSTAGVATTTIIYMHGKTGAPTVSFNQQFATDMAAQGFDVVSPYMPWSGLVWDGTTCEGLLYINQLAANEVANGRKVIVAGHSMGATHAMIHDRLLSTGNVDAYIVLAPGHMPHISRRQRDATASSVTLANQMIAAGNGDQFNTFTIRNGGVNSPITATAFAYASFHDLNVFPDIRLVTPDIVMPVLFLAGASDPITNNLNLASLASNITSAGSQYKVINGDHITMLQNAPMEIRNWATSLGL